MEKKVATKKKVADVKEIINIAKEALAETPDILTKAKEETKQDNAVDLPEEKEDKFWLKPGYDFYNDKSWEAYPEAVDYWLLMF